MFLKSKFVGVALATCAAFAFMGCDEASDAAKKALASVSIEEPIVSIESEYYEHQVLFQKQGDIRKFVKIQSKDNKTILNGINANRGNCATVKYEIDKKKLQAYANANPDKVLLNGGAQLQTTSGELVKPKNRIYTDDDLAYYESLNEQSKAVYGSLFPREIPFGEIKKYYQAFFACKIDSIIEIELIVNDGASISYSFDQSF